MFIPKARFQFGEAVMVPYTNPSAVNNVDGGDVVVVNGQPAIVHVPILPSQTGSAAIGHGMYAGVVAPGVVFADRGPVYWDPAAVACTSVSQGNVYLGYAIGTQFSDGADGQTRIQFWLDDGLRQG